jgi:hypothetical protein
MREGWIVEKSGSLPDPVHSEKQIDLEFPHSGFCNTRDFPDIPGIEIGSDDQLCSGIKEGYLL